MFLRHLRYFLAVVEELSFTGAARKLHVAQPSLTRQIHSLEEELGVRLLNRNKLPVSLTEEGQRFLVDAQQLVALSAESVKTMRRLSRGESRKLDLGYLFRFNFKLLSPTLATFRKNYPEIAVTLFSMSPAEHLCALKARKIDLGFVGLRPKAADGNMDALTWQCVARHDAVVVLPADHPLAKKSKIKISELKLLGFVALSAETHPGWLDWLSSLCQQGGFIPLILEEVDHESRMMTFVAEGFGVTLAPEEIKRLPHPGVAFRPLEKSANVDSWIAWHSDNSSKTLGQYLEVLTKEAGSPCLD